MDWYDSLYRLRELAPRWGLRKGDRAAYNWKGERKKQQQWFDISRVKQTFVVSLYQLMAVIYILKCPPRALVYVLWRFLFLAFSPNYPLDGTVDLALQPSKPPGGILPSEPGKKKSDKTHLVQGRFLLT